MLISTNQFKLENLQCRGNSIGGKLIDNVLLSQSLYLRVLNLSDNNLTAFNASTLLNFVKSFVNVDHLFISGNPEVPA